jgi:menaquinone-dependent protoporphyrinogen oxidase
MTVLVAAASKYGATWEIAEAIGRRLSERGFEIDVRRVEEVDNVAAFEAVVLGSAVYAGHWLEQARRFVDANAAGLRTRPTWLFSSGPIGDPPRPAEEDAVQLDAILAATKPTAHRVFAGRLDKGRLSFPERAVVFAFRAAEGDFRDWDAIAAWADGIADVLEATSSSAQLSSMPSAIA